MKINIKGVIIPNDDKWIYDWFEMDSTCPREVEKEVEKANGEDLEVIINSPGGDVFSGSEIYTLLKDYSGDVVVKIVGVAASAASIIAMAGKKVMMSPTAEMMIHNTTSIARGDYKIMEHEAQVLKDYNSTIANAYMIKSGMSKEELLALMDKETWLTPEKALEYKLIDEIMFMDSAPKLAASFGGMMLPPEVINKIRNTVKNPAQKNKLDFLISKLNYLKLKGEKEDE
ncbi:MAG: head maturation protease, ClpP-related [Petrimonas mucosa]